MSPGHPFYKRLNQVLERHGFDQRLNATLHPEFPPGWRDDAVFQRAAKTP
jgi:hypothetical protein